MFMPPIPGWCWNLLGEDTVRLSQPSHATAGTADTRVFPAAPKVARCEYDTRIGDEADVWSHPYLCGHVALLLEDGSYRCWWHSPSRRDGCAWCAEYAARGENRACPGCHVIWREIGAWCWCCPQDED
jgi:hypothetical protein